jgi:glycosyltransferase involved in cell wall biosynthesis
MLLFSVIIPAYNRAGIIKRAIQSVLDQTYSHFEIIVVDDGSIDSTALELDDFIKNHQIKYVHQSNKGVCAARNTGASIASGQYVVFLDSDDSVEQHWLMDFHHCLENSNADLVFCSMHVQKINGDRKMISCMDPYQTDGKEKGLFLAGAWAMRKSVFDHLGGYDESIRYGENTELKFRCYEQIITQDFIDHYNITYYESLSGGSKQTQNKLSSNLYILSKHANYFAKHPSIKILFLQVAAVSAVKLRDTKLAHQLFYQAWETKPSNLKLIVQCLITLFPPFARFIWKTNTSNP